MYNKKFLNKKGTAFLDNLIFQGAANASIMLYKDSDLVYFQSTNEKWHDFYSNDSASKNCHIAQTGIHYAKKSRDFSLIWDSMIPNNDDSLYLNEQREKYNHCHGISICASLPHDILLGIIITGRRCDLNLAHDVIKRKHILNKEITQLKQIITGSFML